jgi:hypothetical protein
MGAEENEMRESTHVVNLVVGCPTDPWAPY